MKKENLILLLLALLLLAGMLLTLFWGGSRSRHGYGFIPPEREPTSPCAIHLVLYSGRYEIETGKLNFGAKGGVPGGGPANFRL